ncbi:hypothetical protein [Lacinutrix sp. 5H-3-7-4]|nr:hypothetical protein [Lacinutrix sp. 5H-3-7-4]AEH01178.1 hypothetical protein Lacal_1330 [Lacinutrix sp. 5H-3-7-4]
MKRFLIYVNDVLESLDIYTNVNSKPKSPKSPSKPLNKDKFIENK